MFLSVDFAIFIGLGTQPLVLVIFMYYVFNYSLLMVLCVVRCEIFASIYLSNNCYSLSFISILWKILLSFPNTFLIVVYLFNHVILMVLFCHSILFLYHIFIIFYDISEDNTLSSEVNF